MPLRHAIVHSLVAAATQLSVYRRDLHTRTRLAVQHGSRTYPDHREGDAGDDRHRGRYQESRRGKLRESHGGVPLIISVFITIIVQRAVSVRGPARAL